MLFGVFGCNAEPSDDSTGNIEYSPEKSVDSGNVQATSEMPVATDNTESSSGMLQRPIAMIYDSMEQLLQDIVIANFDDVECFGERGELLRPIRSFYVPRSVPEDFYLIFINTNRLGQHSISLGYGRYGNQSFGVTNRAYFGWELGVVTHGSSLRLHSNGREATRNQHGYRFSATLWAFNEQELYDFSYAQPVNAWELQGDAISVIVSGMEDIRIFDEDGNQIASEATPAAGPGVHRRLVSSAGEHHTLYRGDGEDLDRVGYKWLVGAGWQTMDFATYQYVLKPGTYTFHAEGLICELRLTVRHFEDREVAFYTDYTAELAGQSFSAFSITVTPYGSSLNIYE